MLSSREISEPTIEYAPAASEDSDSSSGFSDDSSDTDDAFFADDAPTSPYWQIQYPAQYSIASAQDDISPGEELASGTLEIYRKVAILDHVGSSGNDPWIRLLRLKPGTVGQPLHCKIIKRPLWDAGEYIALSYSWGKNPADQEIYIEDQSSLSKPFHVSMHLWNALQRLRDKKCVVNVWIDAICIDQQNYVERAAQVNIMAQIFNLASEVRVWLGEGALFDHPKTTDAQLFWALCQQPSPWWTRLWILQEVAYARNCPIVMFGARMMSFERLIERWHSVTRFESELSELGELAKEQRKALASSFELLRTPFDIWTSQKNDYEHRRPLLQRLRETAGRECADPRDRIYSLLSLVNENEAKQFQPDYRKPYPELVLEVADVLRQSPSWNERHDKAVFTVLRPDETAATVLSDVSTIAECGTALTLALSDGNVKVIQALLTKCANLREIQWTKARMSYTASKLDSQNIVKMPADDLVDIDAQIYNPALMSAIKMGFEQGVEMLINAGANVNAHDSQNVTALYLAIIERNENAVKMLDDAGANVNAPHGQQSNARQAASYDGLEKPVRMLVDAGANVNALGATYASALQVASYNGYEKIVKILIKARADINAQSGRYGTALQAASVCGRERVVKILIEEGADVNAREGIYGSALLAASKQGHKKIVEMLINRKADIHAPGGGYDNALHAASCAGHMKVMKILKDAGACHHSAVVS